MNTTIDTVLTRTALAITSAVLVTSCGAGTSDNAAPRAVPHQRAEVDAGATYDGWAVRLRRENTPPPCPWSPDQVDRMLESGQPLPACIRRLQRWFQQEYDPSWLPAGRADR